MQNFTKFFALLLTITAVSMTACKEDVPAVEKPQIKLDKAAIEVAAEGGEYNVSYSVENPAEGATATAVEQVEWISNLTVEASKLNFTVEANEGTESREAVITLSYPKAESVMLKVEQAAGADVPTPADEFSIEIEQMTGSSCITRVTPPNNDMYYIMYMSPMDYFFDCEIDSEEELFEDDMFYWLRGADYEGVSLKQYMENTNVLFQGEARAEWSGIQVGVKNVLYVYGVEFNADETNCERITPIAWMIIEPEHAALNDATFDVEIKVDGADVEFAVTPEGWDGYYYVQVFDYGHPFYYDTNEPVTDEYVETLANAWVEMYLSNITHGLTAEFVVDSLCNRGPAVVEKSLMSYTLYTVTVFAIEEVDGVYQMVSRPVIMNFSTEQVEASDMTLDISIENLYVRVCDLRITPSVDDESYIMLLLPTRYLEAGYTDEDLINLVLIDYYSWAVYMRGELSTHISTLTPSTEYMVIAFGFSGGIVTTPVFTETFATEGEGECLLSITDVKYGGPYRISEVVALAPDRFNTMGYSDEHHFLMWLEIETSEPTEELFSYFVDTSTYDAYGEDVIFYDLLIDTCDKVEPNVGQYIYDYYICAAAFDYRGNVTPMWRSEVISWDINDVRPAEELIEKLDAQPNARIMVVGRENLVECVK